MWWILMQWLSTLPQPAPENSTRKVSQGLYLHKHFQMFFRIAGRIWYLNFLSNYTRIIIFQVVFYMNSLFLRLMEFHTINSIIMAENLVLTTSFWKDIHMQTHISHQLLQHLKKEPETVIEKTVSATLMISSAMMHKSICFYCFKRKVQFWLFYWWRKGVLG